MLYLCTVCDIHVALEASLYPMYMYMLFSFKDIQMVTTRLVM